MWSQVVEEMVDCSTPFQMRVKVTFLFFFDVVHGIESPWSCTVRREVFLLDTDSGVLFIETGYTEPSTSENSSRSPP